MSLYENLGGAPALDAAFDLFYQKVLADTRINGYFDGIDMSSLKRKGKAFLTMAFGGPNEYQGKGLRAAHAGPRAEGLDEESFEVFMGHFRATLEELGVDENHVAEVMSIAYSGKDDVLGA
jgi:hemoglobin